MLDRLWKHRAARFIAVAGFCSGLQLVLLAILVRFGVGRLMANGTGFALSAQVNFLLSSFQTWGDRPVRVPRHASHARRRLALLNAWSARWAAFTVVAAGALTINELVFAEIDRPGLWLLIASCAGILAGAIATFTVNNTITFRGEPMNRHDKKIRPGPARMVEIAAYMREMGISFFLPVYNERENLPAMVDRCHGFFQTFDCPYTVIIVDDGSTDGSEKIADELADKDPMHVITVHHNPNRGYGSALVTGMTTALKTINQLTAFCDSDLQFEIDSLPTLVDAQMREQADVVAGFRIQRADSLKRRAMGRAWHWLSSLVLGIETVHDVDCGFKLFSQKFLEVVTPRITGSYAAVSPEICARAVWHGFRIAEVGVTHKPRERGHNTGSDLRVVFKSLSQLFKLRMSVRKESQDGLVSFTPATVGGK